MTFTHNPQKAHTSSVRAKSTTSPTRTAVIAPAPRRPADAANSLFWNILPVSPYSGRFCRPILPAMAVSHRKQIFYRFDVQNNFSSHCLTASSNSLSWKILRVSPYDRIFCGQALASCPPKPFRTKILPGRYQKIIFPQTANSPLVRAPRSKPASPSFLASSRIRSYDVAFRFFQEASC